MPSLNDVKLKIAGVRKTKQITKAMGMVASSKLRGAQGRIERFRPYADKFGQMLGDLAARTQDASDTAHPLLETHAQISNVVILLITSDRGLCGGFNVNLVNAAMRLARQKVEEGRKVSFIAVGRKARDAVKKSPFELLDAYLDVMGSFNFQLATRLGIVVAHGYESGSMDEVFLVSSTFEGMSRQIPTVHPLLPVTPTLVEVADNAVEYIYEPEETTLLAELLPRYVNVEIYRGLLDTSASENAARMAAMENATKNCDDMIGSLTLLYNKTRQASITSDLMDIVGGANALLNQ